MGKLVGLLSSGIGLVVEATASYKTSRSPTPENRSHSHSHSQAGYLPDQTPPQYEEYPVTNQMPSGRRNRRRSLYSEEPPQFHERLSSNYQDEAEYRGRHSEETYYRADRKDHYDDMSSDPQQQIERFQGGYFSSGPSHSSFPTQHGLQSTLVDPVIIPQRRPGDRSRGWVSAYAPSLQSCGITQDVFLEFLTAFNEASKSSGALDAVNVAALGVGFAPGITPMVISMVIPAAVKVAKKKQTESRQKSFLSKANSQLFGPHGLFAMVMTFKPSNQQLDDRTAGEVSPQFPTCAPLIFFSERSASPADGNKFKQMGHFIANYGDRRAQAKFAQEHQDASQILGPTPTFRSRWGDPNNRATNGSSGLRGLITGQVDRRREESEERKRAEEEEKKREEEEEKRGKRPGLIGGVRGMITQHAGMKQDQGLIKGIKSMGMQTDVRTS